MSGVTNNALEVDHVTKVFRDFWLRPKVRAVNDICFNVGRGEVFGLLGPNGSGKSTTLKMVLGLLNPTAGRIRILCGSPHDNSVKATTGYMPEETYLYKHLTARESLDFFGRIFDLPPAVRRERVNQLIEMSGLKNTTRMKIGDYSKGMARKIGLAQALINDPELLILDEPTSGLDPVACRQVKDLVLTLAKRGKTIIMASHVLSDVQDVCNRVAILCNGQVKVQGRVADILDGRKNLEELFLDVIAGSQSDAAGRATSGGPVPEYLTGK
ncbi:MAG: ABC transporter ATP-binding protein [bacterium]